MHKCNSPEALSNTFGDDYQSSVGLGVFAGGQADQFIAVLGGVTGFVHGQLFAGIDILHEFRFVLCIHEPVVGKALAHGGAGAEDGNDLIGVPLGHGVEDDDGMGFVVLLLFVLLQAAEHGAVPHPMAVNGDVIRGLVDIALLPGVDTAMVVVVPVKVPVKVIIGIIRGLHDGVIDLGSFDLDPAHGVGVLAEHLSVALEYLDGLAGVGIDHVDQFRNDQRHGWLRFYGLIAGLCCGIGGRHSGGQGLRLSGIHQVCDTGIQIRRVLGFQNVAQQEEGTD